MVFSCVPELEIGHVMVYLSDVILDVKEKERRLPVS